MRQQGLRARPRRRRLPPDVGERQTAAVAPNVLDRSFAAPAPNHRWIADFTYVWTAEAWLYVATVIDLFSRRVVGWSMSAAMTAQLVTDALVMAIWRRGRRDALLHHSDRGSQYTSEQFQRLMADNGVICSMSRSGNVWDNAAMESFFSSLKTERIGNKTYRTRDEARADVFDYIERFYNAKRRHSTIGYLSPMEFERKAGLVNHVSFEPGAGQTAIFDLRSVQTERYLTDDEVLRINFILKRRATRYIASASEDGLYPERHVSTDHWSKLDHDWFLLPFFTR
jgi:putative transposase